jgi:hypothetical protein
MNRILAATCTAVLLVSPQLLRAQTAALTGSVDVDVSTGFLGADLCIEAIPMQGDTASFMLNRGLNVKRVHDGRGMTLPHETAAELQGVGLRYSVALDLSSGAAPTVCVTYSGAFPVYDVAAGDYRPQDGSSVIAFNGRTLRARGEAGWYPAPMDEAGSGSARDLAYQLTVRCPTCTHIYINGSSPACGPEAELRSDVPREPFLLAGDYPLQTVREVHFLGEAVSVDTAELFLNRVGEVQDFYEGFLGVPFGDPIDVVRIIPVRFDRRGQFWGFFADPALGLVGLTIGDFVEILGEQSHPARPAVLGALAHELAHRYFPGMIARRSAYFQLFSEPFANYLDLKATQHFYGEDVYQERVRALARRVIEGPDLPPLPDAEPEDLSTDAYRYGYAPLLLLSLEQSVGEPQMRTLLNALLTVPEAERPDADYALLRRTALGAGIAPAVWRAWEADCVMPAVSQNGCLQEFIDFGR